MDRAANEKRAFFVQVEEAYRRHVPAMLAFVDVEPTTATLTSEDAEAAREMIAERLATLFTTPDAAIAIGDRFAVLVPGIDRPDLSAAVADRVRAAIDDPVVVDGRALRVIAGIGVATTATASTAAELMRDAERAIAYTFARAG